MPFSQQAEFFIAISQCGAVSVFVAEAPSWAGMNLGKLQQQNRVLDCSEAGGSIGGRQV